MSIATDGFGTIIAGLETGGGGGSVIPPDGEITGTYEGNLVCDGDVTVTGNIEVKGSMLVRGDFINDGGYEVIIRGDLHAQGIYFDKNDDSTPQQNFQVDGDLIFTYMEFRQCGGSAATLRVGGDLLGAAGFSGTYFYGEGTNLSTPGLNVVVYGDVYLTYMNLDGWESDGSGNGGNGGDLYVYGDVTILDQLRLVGGNGSNYDAGNGGSIDIYGNLNAGYGSVYVYGGDANGGSAGNGGGIDVNGSMVANEFEAYGGYCYSDSENHRSGSGGYADIDGNLTVNSYANFNGGDREGVLSTGNSLESPNGGSLYVEGNFVVDGDFNANGGDVSTANYAPHGSGSGGYFSCYGYVSCTDDFRLYGGFASQGNAGNGGNADIEAGLYVDDELELNGGYGSNGNGGNGGNISVRGNLNVGYVNLDGGGGSNGSGGYGGSVYVTGNLNCDDYLSLEGGDCTSDNESHQAGFGGYLTTKNLFAGDVSVYLDGGDRYGNTSVTAYNSPPNGGDADIDGDLHAESFNSRGGSLYQAYPNGAGGQGGDVYVKGNVVVDNGFYLYGGQGRGDGGGVGGYIEVIGHFRASEFSIEGGQSNDSAIGGDATTNGSSGNAYLYGGCTIGYVYAKDGQGSGAAPSAFTNLSLNGSCTIGSLDMSDRANAAIRNTAAQPATLKVNTMPTKQTLNNGGGAATGNISANLADSLFFTDGSQNWYKVTGTSI